MTLSNLFSALKSAWITGLTACLLAAWSPALAQQAPDNAVYQAEPARAEPLPADMVIWGGPIYTADDNQATVDAIAIRDGRFVFVGSRPEVENYVSETTTVVDLSGLALYPGFVDAHAHLSGIGERELALNLEGISSLKSLQQALRDWRQENPEDSAIVGRGWIETHWAVGRFPTRWDLDAVVPDIPVVLIRADGHASVVNSAALKAATITGTTKAPFGGQILKNALGEPNGMLIDAAMGLVAGLKPEVDDARLDEILRTGAQVYAQYGWTGLHNMSVKWREVDIMENLAANGQLPIRVYNSVDKDQAPYLFESGPRFAADNRIITRAIKLYMDGALGSRGALLIDPYADASSSGLLLLDPSEGKEIMARALREGYQVNTHAIGDRGNKLALDWYQEVFSGLAPVLRKIAEPRWRVEHAQILAPGDIERFAQLQVIPSMQPSHAIGDLFFAPDRLGDARLDGAYAWRTLIDSGVIIAGGSDAPVERGDPMIEYYAAVARRSLKGFQGENWRDQEKVTRTEALKMFTLWPAIASFQEDDLGSISVGKRADLTAFDLDIMVADIEQLPKARAVLTIVDGEIVFQAK